VVEVPPGLVPDPRDGKLLPGIPVLMYHNVDVLQPADLANKLLQDLTVSPEAFGHQLKWLRDEGYRFVTASQARAAANRKEPTQKLVCITFDDGYEGNYSNAFPLLKEFGATATFFVVTSALSKPKHMTWEQVIEMQKAGMEFGSHSVTHPDFVVSDDKALANELEASRLTLESKLGVKITDLAYPSGRYDKRVEEATLKAGYEAGWRKDGGPLVFGDPSFALPRIRVSGHLTLDNFMGLFHEAAKKQTEPSHKAKTR
jgi:peptidoglycan/xylan/chitin deacetylase (PgdA/CDA1 family)